MKIRIALGLCVVLGASFVSVRAADNPAQAAARVALERILNPPDDSQARSLPATNTLSEAVVEQPVKSATNATGTVSEKAATPQTAPVATTPVAAPVAEAPAPVAPAAVSPAPVAPAVAPATPFLMLWGLLLSLLVISFVIMSILLLKLRQVKLQLLKHPNVMASNKIQPAAPKASPSTERRESRIKG